MRIGLLADIHEDVEGRRAAIAWLRREGASSLITLGDIFETGARFSDTVDLLRDADVSGVWGNHEFALYAGRGGESGGELLRLEDSRLHAAVDCPTRIGRRAFQPCTSVYRPDGHRTTVVRRARPARRQAAAPNFAAFPHRGCSSDISHRWLAVTARGPVDWSGDRPLGVRPQHSLIWLWLPLCATDGARFTTPRPDVLTPHDGAGGSPAKSRAGPVGNAVTAVFAQGPIHQGSTSGLTTQSGMPVRDIATERFDGGFQKPSRNRSE